MGTGEIMQSIIGVPLIVGDSLYLYSSGRMKNKVMWDGFTSTGLATLRRDGFVFHAYRHRRGTCYRENKV